jgi:hypothetical protein
MSHGTNLRPLIGDDSTHKTSISHISDLSKIRHKDYVMHGHVNFVPLSKPRLLLWINMADNFREVSYTKFNQNLPNGLGADCRS